MRKSGRAYAFAFLIFGGTFMEQTEQSSFLGREKLGKLMLKYSVPCVISLLVAALYNIVDQIFIANAS